MTEAVPEDAFLACARAGLCHVKGMIAFLRGTVAESYPQRLILDVHGVGYEVIVPLSTFDRLNPLPACPGEHAGAVWFCHGCGKGYFPAAD